MVNLAICFHDTDKGIKKWEILSQKIKDIFNQEVILNTFKSAAEENVLLHMKNYDIYYASPENVIKLFDKGYIPLARFKGQRDKFLILSKKSSLNDIKTIALVDNLTSYYCLFTTEKEFDKVEILKNFQNIIAYILENKVDAGIVYIDSFEDLEDKKEYVNILKEIDVGLSHIFCINKDFYEKNINYLDKVIEKLHLEKLGEKELEKIYERLKTVKNIGEKFRKYCITLLINQLLKDINQLIISSVNEDKLFQDICNLIVDKFNFKFAWIGKQEGDFIKPVYKVGNDEGYVDEIVISVREDLPEGKGPTGTAFRTGEIIINENTLTNPYIEPWREKLLQRNIYSSISVPFNKGDKVYAVLTIYSDRFNIFSYEMIELFEELKKDISFTLDKIEKEKMSIILSNVINSSDIWFMLTDANGYIEYVNDYVVKITGYTREEIIGKNPRIFKAGYQPESLYKKLWESLLSGKSFKSLFINKAKNGKLFCIQQYIFPVKFEDGTTKFISLGEIISTTKRKNYRYLDELTNLSNFSSFKLYIENIIDKANKYCALIMIDICNMTYINSNYGIEEGNKILLKFSKKLLKILKDWKKEVNISKNFMVARTGGDEFSIFLDDLNDIQIITDFINTIKTELSKLKFNDIAISYNAGVSIYPVDGKSFDELFNKAKLSLHEAKKEGENIVKIYNQEFSKQVEYYISAEKLVRRVFEEKLFKFYFQPYVISENFRIEGFESLIRIVEKDGAVHYPNKFIDFLENSRYLIDFEKWGIFEIAEKIDIFNTKISFNLSSKGILNNEIFLMLSSIPKDTLSKLVLEITERNILKDIELSKEILYRIKMKFPEVKIAIDDFGTGYSSLAYLKELPIDKLKIDISFIRNMLNSKKDLALIELFVDLGKKFGFKTVAEGVETEDQAKILALLGVDYIQGYLISKPIPEEEVVKLLKNQQNLIGGG